MVVVALAVLVGGILLTRQMRARVPNLVGSQVGTTAGALKHLTYMLEAQHLELGTVSYQVCPPMFLAGVVYRQDPSPHEVVAHGTTVDIVVCR